MASTHQARMTKRMAVRSLEAKRDSLIVKKAAAHEELVKTRDLLKRARAK